MDAVQAIQRRDEIERELAVMLQDLHLRQGFEVALAGGIFDGDPEGCVCTTDCQAPCFLRVGLTTDPCCKGCAPLEVEA